jgi:DNA glycosylase AlkZ-like
VREVSWSAANIRRLERHALHPPAPSGTDPAEIAAAICGAHAQVLSAAEVSLALRIQGATRATIRRAMWDDHKLIKTYGPRGTVHLLPTEDLPIWTAALSAIPAHSPFPDDIRLTPAQAKQIVDAIGRALEDAELTIDELDRAIVDLVGSWAGDRVMPASRRCGRDGGKRSARPPTAVCCASGRTRADASPIPIRAAGSRDAGRHRRRKLSPR